MANNDTFELTSKMIKGVQGKETQARRNDMKLFRSTQRKYSISPLYQRYIGDFVTVAFNGNFKKFPVNGEQFDISEGHYRALRKYLNHVDRQIRVAQTSSKFIDSNVSGDFKKI